MAKIGKRFLKEEVIAAFDGVPALARFFGIRREAIYQWRDGAPIPELRKMQILLRRPEVVRGYQGRAGVR